MPEKKTQPPNPLNSPDSTSPDSNTRSVTLRDIGRHVGVSHATVSLVLRDRPGISEEMRKKVLEAIKTLGYRPDPVLAALNNYRRRIRPATIRAGLGWINLWRDASGMHAYREVDAYWQGAKAVAEKHGYQLYEFSAGAKNTFAAVERVMRARNIEGVLISPPEPRAPVLLPNMEWRHFSIVRYGHGLGDSLPFHLVTSAQAANTLMAIRKLGRMGYRRIGFVSSYHSSRNMQFIHGYLRAREDFPVDDRLPHLSLPEESVHEDGVLLKQWLDTYRPDAIFSNLSTIRAQLERLGYEVPGKLGLAVTSVQDCDADSGIDQSPYEIGKIGCETLISLLMNGYRGFPEHPREILVEGRWVEGGTVRNQLEVGSA